MSTDSRTWRDLKMGITGTIKPGPRDRTAPKDDEGKSTESGEGSVTDEDKDTLALETVVTVEDD